MRKLFGRVVELLRKNPILWLPYIAAELLASGLWELRGLVQSGIMHWFTTGHFVMDGRIALTRNNLDAQSNATIACIPIGIAAVVLVVTLFVAALVATSAIVDSIEREQRFDARDMMAGLGGHYRRILLLGLRFLAIFVVFAAGTIGLLYYLLLRAHRQYLYHLPFWLLAGMLLVAVGCTAWLVMPPAIRLLRGGAAVQVSVRTRNLGTILAILAAEAGAVIGFFVQKLEAPIVLNSQLEITALAAFNSVITHAPYALFFIALALLTNECYLENDSKRGSKNLELLQHLMPSHYGKNEEPPQVNV